MKLRQYQTDIAIEAAAKLHKYGIAYLSMQVRTGKTITAMEAAKQYGAKCVLFATKKKAIGSIESDYMANYQDTFTMYCVNYESIHKLPNNVIFDLVILDEAHCLGQYPIPANRTEAIRDICVNLPIIYLSGTPTPESYSQLFHQLWVSSFTPFTHKTFYKWANDYVQVQKKYLYNREINDYSTADKPKIDNETAHLFISYTQEQAGFEQYVQEKIHIIQMDPMTHEMAKRLRRDRVIAFRTGGYVEADTEVKLMNKLHQIYSGTVIREQGEPLIFDRSKIKYIIQHFTGKTAIFYKFKAERDMIADELKAAGIQVTDSPEIFAANPNMWFYSQIQSGREGINLSAADDLVMYNIDFSAVSYWQARARMQSKDRTKEIIVHWLFADKGIEPRIYKAVSDKKDYTLSYFRKDEKIQPIHH
jgi:superfamily II DNA or RNA helicase